MKQKKNNFNYFRNLISRFELLRILNHAIIIQNIYQEKKSYLVQLGSNRRLKQMSMVILKFSKNFQFKKLLGVKF